MKVMDSFRIVWRNLWRMKLRTALTSVGVMIGTAAIVAMIALSLGLKENAVKSLENFGNLTEMDVEPMYYIPEEDRVIPDEERKKLNMEAVQELKQIPGIAAVMPVKRLQEQAKLKVGRREGYVELIGVDVNESAAYRKNDIDKGSYLSGSPQEIVIASDVPREMRDVEKEKREARRSNVDAGGKGSSPMPPPDMGGGAPAPLNLVDKAATIMLSREYRVDDEPKYEKKELRVRIVGQLQKSENQRYSTAVYVPINVVKELNDWVNRSRGDETSEGGPVRRTREQAKQDHFEFDQMTVKVESREQVEGVVKALKEKGYEVWSPARELETINKFFFVIQIVLGGIAAISLLVATIGIVNTMIMSILERTKEIGIMKVIGATVFNIRWLFLMESGFIGLIGGLTGLGLAWGAVELVNYFGSAGGLMDSLNMGYGRGGEGEGGAAAKLAVIPGWLALFAIGFSFVIGLLAGIFPAIRASRLSALQAIRSE